MSVSRPKKPNERQPLASKNLAGHVRDTGHEAGARASGLLRWPRGKTVPVPVRWGRLPRAEGSKRRREIAETIGLVDRAFAFVDLCGFTRFIATHGEHAAIDTLSRFRSLARDIAVRRGVLVAKWLGDGAMIVGVEVGPTVGHRRRAHRAL